MSTIYVPNTGEVYLLEHGLTTDDLTLGLFKNDLSLSHATILGDITAADFTGYAEKTLTSTLWEYSTLLNKGHAQYEQQNFIAGTIGTECTVYGVYCYESVGSILVYAEKFDNSVTVNTTGQVVSYIPVIEASTS